LFHYKGETLPFLWVYGTQVVKKVNLSLVLVKWLTLCYIAFNLSSLLLELLNLTWFFQQIMFSE